MTYEKFKDYITSKCFYDAIYEDQEGREIIVMTVLDAYSMASKLAKREWVGLTQKEVQEIHDTYHKRMGPQEFASMLEAKLKEKNNGT
jgi:hypothetical protein